MLSILNNNKTCHDCRITGNLARKCPTLKGQYQNTLDINIDLGKISSNSKIDISVHTEEKPYQCIVCAAKFQVEDDLHKHAKSHAEEKPFQCIVCDEKFQVEHDLNKHAKSHKGPPVVKPSEQLNLDATSRGDKKSEKILYCTICDFKCTEEDDFGKHMLSHNGEKTYKCTDCDFTSQSVNIHNNHIKTHQGKSYGCTKCDKKFSSKIDLNFHMKNHSEVTAIDTSYAKILSSPVSKWSSSISSSKPPRAPVLKLTALKKRCISTSPEGKPSNKQQVV